jgi:hypothetical protein
VEIPSRDDDPPFFTVTTLKPGTTGSRPDVKKEMASDAATGIASSGGEGARVQAPTESSQHVGELITLIVTPEPMLGLPPLDNAPVKLASDQVSSWEEKWGGSYEKYEMAEGAGKRWTDEEKSAGERGGTPLTRNSPLPQTIYRISNKPGEPILITVPLLVPVTVASTEITLGQTISNVVEALGRPMRVVNLGAKKIYVYRDMKITFTNGRVSDVQH